MEQQGAFPVDLIIILIYSIYIAYLSNVLAKEKGRNVLRWTIIGLIPVINFAALMYFVGASNLKVEKKLDEILSRLEKPGGWRLTCS